MKILKSKSVWCAVLACYVTSMQIVEPYDGKFAEAKGGSGGGSSTTVQKADPWSGAQKDIKGALSGARDLYNQGPLSIYDGPTQAALDPLQQQGLDSQAAFAQSSGLQNSINNMGGGVNSLLNAPDIANNQYVAGMADTVQGRMNDNFQNNIMPAIGHGATNAGQYGSSRQGIAEGLAAKGTQQAIGDATASIYGNAYSQGLDAQAKGVGLAPMALQAQSLPGQMMQQVGSVYQNQEQNDINSNINKFNAEQMGDWQNLDRYSNIAMAAGGMGGTTQSIGPQKAGGGGSALSGALGGGMTGFSMGGLPGAAAGAILGGLFS